MACVEMAWIKFGFGSALGCERSGRATLLLWWDPLLSLVCEVRTRGLVFWVSRDELGWVVLPLLLGSGVGGLVCPDGLDGWMGFVGCVVAKSIDVVSCFDPRCVVGRLIFSLSSAFEVIV
jgi:hypothetical protein